MDIPGSEEKQKKRELVVSFALKQVSANTLARCGQKNNHPTLAYMHKQERSETIPNAYKQNERYIVFILLLMIGMYRSDIRNDIGEPSTRGIERNKRKVAAYIGWRITPKSPVST